MSLALTEKQTREIEALCQIARENGAAISLRELIGLAAIDASEHELEGAFLSDSNMRSRFLLESGFVLERSLVAEKGALQIVEEERRRRARASANLMKAWRFGKMLTKGAVFVSVSGANSYLVARDNEDIDYFCVTRTNGMWRFILKTLILARIHRLANKDVPELCFSCIMDEKWAIQAFMARQPPIFARDALAAKVIGGNGAYHGLLSQASWMEDYFPAHYRTRLRETGLDEHERSRSDGTERGSSAILNSFLFHILGSFLRTKSWALNRKLTKAERYSSIFNAKIGTGHFIYESNKYRNLRAIYEELVEEASRQTLEEGKQDYGAAGEDGLRGSRREG
jgi:hypothetical protein